MWFDDNYKFKTAKEIKKIHGKDLNGKIWIDGGYLIIHTEYDSYDIGLDRLDTPEKILRWVVQLSSKTWMTQRLMKEFVIGCCERIGVSPFGC